MGMFETLGKVMGSPLDTLKLKCLTCGHEATFSRETAFKWFGPHSSPYQVKRRAKCSECNALGMVAVWV